MKIRRQGWDGTDPRELAASLRAASPDPAGIAGNVAEIIAQVRSGGDVAVAELGERFDGIAAPAPLVGGDELDRASNAISADLRGAIELCAANVRAVSEAQIDRIGDSVQPVLGAGQLISTRDVTVGSAAIYVPGGRASYPSSVIMGVVPAKVAGVARVVVASPPGESGLPADSILAAASIAGADEVYAVGGAQAIAALANGTETISAVDVIAGPGNPWVQEAKLQCSRFVGIDGYAGPSELLVICDAGAPIGWIALDVCAQAEHGTDGVLVVVSTDEPALTALASEIQRVADERQTVTDATVTLIAAPGVEDAIALAQALAPEHLELIVADHDRVADRLTTPGCVFVGGLSATAFGDYAAGSNHVLPTGGSGRFAGPLGPETFRRRISRVEIDGGSAAALSPAVDEIARAEGFPVHGESALARRNAPAQGE